MSIKFSGYEPYYRTGPSSTSYTICVWLKVNQQDTAFRCLFNMTNGSSWLQMVVPENALYLAIENSGSGSNTPFSNAVTAGEWVFVSMRSSGTGSGNEKAVLWRSATGWEEISQTGISISSPNLYLGGNDYSPEAPYVSMQYVKVWDTALTLDEVKQEAFSARPVRYANLWAFYPWFDQSVDTIDFSGNGRTLTQYASGQEDDTSPPVSWGVTEAGLLVPNTALWEPNDTDWFEVQLASFTDPEIDTDWVLNISRYKNAGNVRFHYALMQGSTVIQEWADTAATETDTVLALPVTNASAITSTSDLRVRVKRIN